MEMNKMSRSDDWDGKEKNQSPSINRKIGFALLTTGIVMSVIYFGYLLTEAFATDCAKWSCMP